MKVVGGSVVTLMMNIEFSDLKIDETLQFRMVRMKIETFIQTYSECSDSVYNISCLSEPLKPGFQGHRCTGNCIFSRTLADTAIVRSYRKTQHLTKNLPFFLYRHQKI